MTKKKEASNPNEVTRIETNRFGEEEEVTYQLGMVIKRVKVVKPPKKETKKEKESKDES